MLDKDAALALLPDLPERAITAARMRLIVESIYDHGIDNIGAINDQLQGATAISEAVLGTVVPWDPTGTYTAGDTVLSSGRVFLCLRPVSAPHPGAPTAGSDWAILDYASQYATMVDLELRVHALEGKP